jgi:ammonia channel protein AmtB
MAGPLHILYNSCSTTNIFFLIATTNLNQWYQSGDQAFIIVASCMVLLMIPGLGFLYSGLARRKSALSMIWACMGSFSVIVFQWYLWGYSLAFSNSGMSGFIGDLTHFGLMNTLGEPSPGSPLIPELLYSFYQVRTYCGNLLNPRLISSSCNSVPQLRQLLLVPLLSEVV